jgi:hypothetical protein
MVKEPAPLNVEPAFRFAVPPENTRPELAGTENEPVLVPPPPSSIAPLVTVVEPVLLKSIPLSTTVVVPFDPSPSTTFVTVPALLNVGVGANQN